MLNKFKYRDLQSSRKQIVNLDISIAPYDEGGVKNYYWPLPCDANLVVRDSLITFIAKLIEEDKEKSSELLAVRIFFKWFLVEVFKWYEASILARQFKEDEMIPIIPDYFPKFFALYHNQELKCEFFLDLKMPQKGKKIPKLIKRSILEFQWNKWEIKNLIYRNYEREVVCVTPNALVLNHARSTKQFLCYRHLTDWFVSECPTTLLHESSLKPPSKTVEAILDCVEQAFIKGHENLPEVSRQYIYQWLAQAETFATYHLQKLHERKHNLPGCMWFSSVGHLVWNCLLSEAVRENGGEVVTHDHGSPNAHHEQRGQHYTDFIHVDEFFTFNKTTACVKKKELRKELMLGQPIPNFKSLDDIGWKGKNVSHKTLVHVNRRIRKLMYVATAFHGEGARLRPVQSDISYFDWQIRLLKFLKQQNIEVIYKPHPEGQARPHDHFAEVFGAKTINLPFEEVKETVGGYLIDFNGSSTTSKIINSALPVIYIDFGYPELLPEAKRLWKKRCIFIDSYTDENNKIQIDWNELQAALEKKEHFFSRALSYTYYRNT